MMRWIGLCLFLGLSCSLSAQSLEGGSMDLAYSRIRSRHPEGVKVSVEGRDFISKAAFEWGMMECYFRDEENKEYELRLDTVARFFTYDAVQFPAYVTPPTEAYWQKALRLSLSAETRKALSEQSADGDPTIFLSFIYDEKGRLHFLKLRLDAALWSRISQEELAVLNLRLRELLLFDTDFYMYAERPNRFFVKRNSYEFKLREYLNRLNRS